MNEHIQKGNDDKELRRNAQGYLAWQKKLRAKDNISIIGWGLVYNLILYGWMFMFWRCG